MNLLEYQQIWEQALNGDLYDDHYNSYLQLNKTRFNRIFKTFTPSPEFIAEVSNIKQPTLWIIITEPWCGDAAQNVPLILKLIQTIPNASYTIELRDQSSLIEQYLTNGVKGIPKLIVRDNEGHDLFTWGPRTYEAQELFNNLRTKEVDRKVMYESLHGWYTKDNGKSLQVELQTLIRSLNY